MSKVDVEHVPLPGDHDVVVVPIADAENESCYTVACAHPCEVLHGVGVLLGVRPCDKENGLRRRRGGGEEAEG